MHQVALETASTQLAELVREVRGGEEVILTQGNQPIAKIVPVALPRLPRKAGSAKHLPHNMAKDFGATPEGFEEYMP